MATRMRSIHFFLFALLAVATLMAGYASAGTQQQIDEILAQHEPPFGVVFEIVESDDDALQWAIPEANRYVKLLRERFPEIGLAVVSHGSEQFGLMKSRQQQNAPVHQAVLSLVSSDVPVVVCGTHASWRNKNADDFPNYVDVAPAGPAAISNYQSIGFKLVVIRKP